MAKPAIAPSGQDRGQRGAEQNPIVHASNQSIQDARQVAVDPCATPM